MQNKYQQKNRRCGDTCHSFSFETIYRMALISLYSLYGVYSKTISHNIISSMLFIVYHQSFCNFSKS